MLYIYIYGSWTKIKLSFKIIPLSQFPQSTSYTKKSYSLDFLHQGDRWYVGHTSRVGPTLDGPWPKVMLMGGVTGTRIQFADMPIFFKECGVGKIYSLHLYESWQLRGFPLGRLLLYKFWFVKHRFWMVSFLQAKKGKFKGGIVFSFLFDIEVLHPLLFSLSLSKCLPRPFHYKFSLIITSGATSCCHVADEWGR